MIIELIGTWLIVGFFTSIGWKTADETVNKPYLEPYLEKKISNKPETPTNPPAPTTEGNK